MFLYKYHWKLQKAEKQRKIELKFANEQKQIKAKLPAENAGIWWLQ